MMLMDTLFLISKSSLSLHPFPEDTSCSLGGDGRQEHLHSHISHRGATPVGSCHSFLLGTSSEMSLELMAILRIKGILLG